MMKKYGEAERHKKLCLSYDKPLFTGIHQPRQYHTSGNDAPRMGPLTRGPIPLSVAWSRTKKEETQQPLVPDESSPSAAPLPQPVSESKYDNVNAWRREAIVSTGGTRCLDESFNMSDAIPSGETGTGSVDTRSPAEATGGANVPENEISILMRQRRRERAQMNASLANERALLDQNSVGSRVSEPEHTSTRKTISADIEPAVIIPRTWGSRARPQKNWLARYMAADGLGRFNQVGAPAPEPAARPEPFDWLAVAADVALPSTEEDSSGLEPTPPNSRPPTAHYNNEHSTQKSGILDAEQDFTAKSILVSTSPPSSRWTAKLNAIRVRDLESNSHAVATGRLDEMKERKRSASPEVVRPAIKDVLAEMRSWDPKYVSRSKLTSTQLGNRSHSPEEAYVPLAEQRGEDITTSDRSTRDRYVSLRRRSEDISASEQYVSHTRRRSEDITISDRSTRDRYTPQTRLSEDIIISDRSTRDRYTPLTRRSEDITISDRSTKDRSTNDRSTKDRSTKDRSTRDRYISPLTRRRSEDITISDRSTSDQYVPLTKRKSEDIITSGRYTKTPNFSLPIVTYNKEALLPEMVPLPPLSPFLEPLCAENNMIPFTENLVPISGTTAISTQDVSPAEQDRQDIRDTLRRLSRMISTASSLNASTDSDLEKSQYKPAKVPNVLSVNTKRLSGASTPPKSDIDPEERIVAEASLFELPDIKSERNSLRTPSAERTQAVEEMYRSKPEPPTPVVTGAYIQTPATREPVEPRLTSASIKEMLTPKRTKVARKIANTAHTYTVQEDLQIIGASTPSDSPSDGELSSTSTVPLITQSEVDNTATVSTQDAAGQEELETVAQIVEPEVESITSVDTKECDCQKKRKIGPTVTEPETEIDAVKPISQKEIKTVLRAVEHEVDGIVAAHSRSGIHKESLKKFQELEQALQTSLQGIREAKQGIEQLEDRVSSALPAPLSAPEPTSPAVMYLMVPIPRLWHSSTPFMSTDSSGQSPASSSKSGRVIHPTALGFLLALLMLWLIAETAVCEAICHPKYATPTTKWKPTDPFWGYALPTLANRVSGGLLGVLWALLCHILGPVLQPPLSMLLDVLWYL